MVELDCRRVGEVLWGMDGQQRPDMIVVVGSEWKRSMALGTKERDRLNKDYLHLYAEGWPAFALEEVWRVGEKSGRSTRRRGIPSVLGLYLMSTKRG
jgi:hypothetical protein